MLARVPEAATATAAADRATEAEDGKVVAVGADDNAFTVEADEDGLTIPSSSITDRPEIPPFSANPSVCSGCF